MGRKGIVDRLMLAAAQWHADRCLNRFLGATQQTPQIQERVLREKLARNAASDFGRQFGFASIRTYEDFVRQVPILRYEDHQPFIERVKRGEFSAMFGPRQRVLMFALTSGTTTEPKYIPVTDAFLGECRRGWNAFGLKALLDHRGSFLRRIVQITSRMDESTTEAGIPCGAITGLMAATQKRLVRKYYVAPPAVSYIDDTTAKYYTIMRLAVPTDVAFMITASPATQLHLARTADEFRAELIRDVRDGTLCSSLPIGSAIRQQLAPRLQPNPAAARRLEDLVTTHGALLPKHYWNLKFLANWTGGTMGLYLRQFPHYFGHTPVRDIGLIASEGRVSIPVDDHTPVGILDVMSHFFEFVPRREYESDRPIALRAHEVEPGGEYYVVMTTSAGLVRYDLGDLVRVHGFYGSAPMLEFLNKGAHISSMAGEKLAEQQVILAMQRVASALGVPIDTFVVAPQWEDVPYYRLHIEPCPALSDEDWQRLADSFDAQLAAVNIEYEGKRKSGRLGGVQVNRVPDGYFVNLAHALRTRHRPGNEQYKHQYLYVTPDADADFPLHLVSGAAPSQPTSRTAYQPAMRSEG